MKQFLDMVFRRHKKVENMRIFYSVLGVIVLLSSLFCLWLGMQQSVWFDEAYSIMVAKRPLQELIALVALDTHPPLYYILLKGWASIFGWSEMALRSLSVIFFGASLTVLGLFIRKFFNSRVALYVVGVAALSPLLIRYGFEIRMYSLASFVGIAATYTLAKAWYETSEKKKTGYWVLYAVLVALGMYSLYYLALLWISHVVWLITMWAKDKKKQGTFLEQPWIYAYGGSVLLFIPWLFAFVKQLSNNALAPIGQQMNLENMIGIFSFNFLYKPLWQLTMFESLMILAVIILVCYSVLTVIKSAKKDKKSLIFLLVVYITVPVAVLVVVSFARSMYVERYLSHIAIGFVALNAVTIWLASERWSRTYRLGARMFVFAVLLFGVGNLVAVGNFNFQRMQQPDVKQAAAQLNDCRDGSTILAADPYTAIELEYYLPGCDVHFVAKDDVLRGGYAPLNGSTLQVKDASTFSPESSVVHVVFYGDKEPQLSRTFKNVATQKLQHLSISSFISE